MRLGDCELPGGWLFEQPVNAWSSLGFVVVGIIISLVVVRRHLTPWWHFLAAASALEGLGSVLFHGGATRGGHFVHDLGLFAIAAYILAWQASRLTISAADHQERRERRDHQEQERRKHEGAAGLGRWMGGAIVTVVATGALWWVSSDATNAIVGVFIAAIAVTELVARRRGLGGIWSTALVVTTVIAIGAWLLGRSDSPLCEPESVLQPHAVWHVLSAVLVLGWFDRALEVADPVSAPRLFRRSIDRVAGLVARALVRTFHRSVDTIGADAFPHDRPVLVVANHGNGFVDPVVVAAALGRLPRFLAKAALWKVVVARGPLGLAGALPVYRRSDGDDVSNNRSVFAACHDELARSATVAIFPEGTTGDRVALDRVRSGAARIALGSVDRAPDLLIVPMGLAFESRYETRTRALVQFGEPIEVAEFHINGADSAGEPDHGDVERLTDAITEALERVSPEFPSVEERDAFRAAARIATVDGTATGRGSFANVELTARRLGRADEDPRGQVMDAFDEYARRLVAAGLVDRDLAERSTPRWRIVVAALALVVVGSFVATATLIHLPALVLVVVATSSVHATATKGTVRVLVGAVAGLLTWIIAGIVIADGWAALAATAIVALGGMVSLAVWTPLVDAARTVLARLRTRARGSGLDELMSARGDLIRSVDQVAEITEVAEGTVPHPTGEGS